MATILHNAQVGTTAPDFSLNANTGRVGLADYRGQQNVILFFMREFSCTFCRSHAAHLGRLYPRLQQQGTTVLVIGGGTQADATKLAQTYKLPFPVLADPDRSVYARYGLEKVMMGMFQRSSIALVDKGGTIRYIQQATIPANLLNEKEVMDAVASVQ